MTTKFACPCCGYKTLNEEPTGTWEICQVCFWEDDPIQFDDINYEGGANTISLLQSQRNFLKFGACEERFIKNVRPPHKDEERDEGWTPFTENL